MSNQVSKSVRLILKPFLFDYNSLSNRLADRFESEVRHFLSGGQEPQGGDVTRWDSGVTRWDHTACEGSLSNSHTRMRAPRRLPWRICTHSVSPFTFRFSDHKKITWYIFVSFLWSNEVVWTFMKFKICLYFWVVFGPWRGSVASYATDERAKNDQKERWRLKLEEIKRQIESSSEKFRRLQYMVKGWEFKLFWNNAVRGKSAWHFVPSDFSCQSLYETPRKSSHTIWCERSHQMVWALVSNGVSARIKWCERSHHMVWDDLKEAWWDFIVSRNIPKFFQLCPIVFPILEWGE